jgi:hypothetical protein
MPHWSVTPPAGFSFRGFRGGKVSQERLPKCQLWFEGRLKNTGDPVRSRRSYPWPPWSKLGIMLTGMQSTEIGHPVDAEQHPLAINHDSGSD